MKLLVGTIIGIVLAVGGVAYASNTHQTTAATDPSRRSSTRLAGRPADADRPRRSRPPYARQQLAGELTRKDTGAFELTIGERNLRIIVAHAKVTNLAGRPMALPLDDATARVTGKLLPRSAWRLDDDGQLLPTFAASRVVLVTSIPREQTSEAVQTDQTEG